MLLNTEAWWSHSFSVFESPRDSGLTCTSRGSHKDLTYLQPMISTKTAFEASYSVQIYIGVLSWTSR